MPSAVSPNRCVYIPADKKLAKNLSLGDEVELIIKGRVESLSQHDIGVQVGSMKAKVKGNSYSALNENWGGQKDEESNEIMDLLTPVSADYNRGY